MESANPAAIPAAEAKARHPRERRVRSVVRKRGGRGMRKKKPRTEKDLIDGGWVSAAAPPSLTAVDGGDGGRDVGMKSKRRPRERKNRKWKPFSEMTWQEKLEREEYEAKRAEKRDVEVLDPPSRSKRARKKRRGIIDIPRAPRNTTQGLIDQRAGRQEEQLEDRDFEGGSRMTSMQGLIHRGILAEESSDDEFDSERDSSGHSVGKNGSPGGSCSPVTPLPGDLGAGVAGQEEQDDRDRRIRDLEAENSLLRARIRTLEDRAAAS